MKEKEKDEQRILKLTLKKKWFDMIASGEKKEEYRDIKEYWERRLENPPKYLFHFNPKKFDYVLFTNGYSKDSPQMKVECLGIEIAHSKPELCDGLEDLFYVIKLGKVIWHNKPSHFR